MTSHIDLEMNPMTCAFEGRHRPKKLVKEDKRKEDDVSARHRHSFLMRCEHNLLLPPAGGSCQNAEIKSMQS